NGLAMDLQRFLADEPVFACPPSAGYRLRKFARRNKGALAVTALLGVVLLFVLVGAPVATALVWGQWKRAEDNAARQAEQRERAHKNAARAIAVLDEVELHRLENQLVRAKVLHEPERDRLKKLLAFYEEFVEGNRDLPEVRKATARAYEHMGAIHRLLATHRK